MQREFKVSLSPHYYSEVIRLSQYDANYPLIITVFDKTAQASINGMTAYFEGTRSDGLSFRYSGTAVGSKIQFTIDTALTAVAGKHTGEVVLYDGSGLWFGSANVQILVEKAARPDNAIDADVTAQQTLLEQITSLAEQTEESADAIINMTVSAQTLAQGAEATVTKTVTEGAVNLHFGLPLAGGGSTGGVTEEEFTQLKEGLNNVSEIIGHDHFQNNFQTGAYSSNGVVANTGRAYCIYTGVQKGSKLFWDASKWAVNYYYLTSETDFHPLYTPNVWDSTGEITLDYKNDGVVFVAIKSGSSSLASRLEEINHSVWLYNNLADAPMTYNGVVSGTTIAENSKIGLYSVGGSSTAIVSQMTDMPCDDFSGGYLLNTYVGAAGTTVRQTLVEINSGTTLGRTFSRTIGYDWVGVGYANWVAFGDSITHGSYSDAQGNTLNNSRYSYAYRIAKNLRREAVAKFYNCGVRGIGWVNTGNNGETFADMMALFTGDKSSINLVTVMLGINDYLSNETLGTTESAENDGTISGAIRYGLRYLCENYPNAKIIAISPLNSMNHGTAATGWSRNTRLTLPGSLQDVCDMIAYWCNVYNVTYINEISESFLNNYNMPTYLGDHLHPTNEGQWMLARELSEKIFTGVSSRDGTGGQDGYSPTVTITPITGGHRITITDKDGTETADVMDGTNGTNGQDGYSPTASVSKSGGTATITITDKNGTTTATVSDGQNGTNGTNGTNGSDGTTFTPSVSSAGVISWTNDGNKQNPSSVDLVAAIPTATTQTAGKMSATDKGRLDTLYADYSSALTALGVI